MTLLRSIILTLCLAFVGCGGALAEYRATCGKVTSVVNRIKSADSRLQKSAKALIEVCSGDSACEDAVRSAYTPVAVLIGNSYGFAESLQRGGVCSSESVAYLEEVTQQVEEIERVLAL